MCQLHLESRWTKLSAALNSGTAELLLAVPDLEEKPNFTKLAYKKLVSEKHINFLTAMMK
jgi:hypothetical protein